MLQLNFPKYDFRVKKSTTNQALIFDEGRKQWLVLSPEEWVRQHWIKHLHQYYGYPVANMMIESKVKVYKKNLRSDILVYFKNQQYILVECKQPMVPINAQTLQQAVQYNSNYACPYIVLSNGLQHYFFQYNAEKIAPINELPFAQSV